MSASVVQVEQLDTLCLYLDDDCEEVEVEVET